MIARIGIKIGQWMFAREIIKRNQIDMIRYSLEIMCSEFLEILIIGIYSIVTEKEFQTLMFLIYFQLLRRMYQGYHAKTIGQCFLLTISVYLFVLYVHSNMLVSICLIILMCVSLVQLKLCMRNKYVDSFIVSIILIGFSILMLLLNNYTFVQILSLTECIVLISYFQKGGCNEK